MAVLLMSMTTDETSVERAFFKKIPERLAFIPAKTDSSRQYFNKVSTHFEGLGVKKVVYCDLDSEFKPSVWQQLDACDCFYLSGGSAPHFLKRLHERGAIDKLRTWSSTKDIIGVSGGALVLGQDISILTSAFERGYTAKALSDPSGVGLYDFEFWPHHGKHETDERRFLERSKVQDKVILSCDDFSGISISKVGIQVLGSAFLYRNGKSEVLKSGTYKIPLFN